MRVLLRDLAPGQEYAIQFRANNGESFSEWSQITRFTTTNDLVAPAQPLNLVWFNSGPAFIATWDKVTTNSDGSPLKDFRHYVLTVTDGISIEEFTVSGNRFEFTREMNAAAFGEFKSALSISVVAVDNTYNESAPTGASVDPAAPPVPSPPVLSAYYGSILLEWDGKDTDGANMPANVDFVEIHIGDNSDFVPGSDTYFDRIILNRSSATQRSILAGLDNGETYYAKLIVVDILQKRSNPSLASNATTKTNLTGLEIENGQIGKNQINFTARDIGGANAYYVADIAARDAIDDAVAGDIAYITGAGYATYEYNGTAWVANTNIGVVSGTKILAGTVTADAVGTNLIISAKANIGEAIIDSSHIDQLNANVITAGSLQSQFMVNYAGEAVARPAWKLDVNGNLLINNAEIKGQLVIGDANNTVAQNSNFAIRSFNYIAGLQGWTINGDGTVEFASGTFRGTLQTSVSGARVVIGTTTNSKGTFGQVELFDFNSRRISLTTGTLATQDPSGNPTFMLGFDDLFNYANASDGYLPPNAIHMVKNGAFTVQAGSIRLNGASFGAYTGQYGLPMIGWSSTQSFLYGPQNGTLNPQRFIMPTAGTFEFYPPGANTGSIRFQNMGATNPSPGLQLFAGSGHGNKFFVYQDGRGVWTEHQGWNGSYWAGIRAGAYENASDMRLKEDIVTAETAPLLAEVIKTRITKFKMKPPTEIMSRKLKTKKKPTDPDEYEDVVEPAPVMNMPVQIGLIGQEAPEQIRSVSDDGSMYSVDLYQMIAMVWGAVQELTKLIKGLDDRLTILENKKK